MVADGYALKDLFIEIYHWSRDTANTGQLSDQAAYNVLINLNHFKENVQKVDQEEVKMRLKSIFAQVFEFEYI
jgi:hypothetical protein